MPLLPISEIEQLAPVFRGKTGNALARGILHMFEFDKVEELYAKVEDIKGPDGARGILELAGVRYSVAGEENLDNLPEGSFITISNHPIGSLDGIILIDFIAHMFPDFKVMVNKILGRVRNLEQNFISVTPVGEKRSAPTAESISGVRMALEHIRDGHPLGLFPSGAVSDLIPGKRPEVTMPDGSTYKEPNVRDRDWQMPIIKFISKARVPVVPIRFFDGNSWIFYALGAIHGWKIRLTRFPHEMLNKAGKTIRLGIGPVITPEQLGRCADSEELRILLRGAVYGMIPDNLEFKQKL